MQITNFDNCSVISLQGRIDHTVAEAFERELMGLMEQGCDADYTVVLDMREVEYMSSVGLRVLMVAAKYCKSEGGKVLVSALQPTMQEIFEISRFDKIFSTFDDTLLALQSVDPQIAEQYSAQPIAQG